MLFRSKNLPKFEASSKLTKAKLKKVTDKANEYIKLSEKGMPFEDKYPHFKVPVSLD